MLSRLGRRCGCRENVLSSVLRRLHSVQTSFWLARERNPVKPAVCGFDELQKVSATFGARRSQQTGGRMTDAFCSKLLTDALDRLTNAAEHANISPEVLEKLKYPRETLQTRIFIRMDDGSRRAFKAWRCRYDDTLGPTKGGIRFHPSATIDEVETLAFWMTLKCAVLNLPFGGGKGAVAVDPKSLSRPELERLSRAYIQHLAQPAFVSPTRDIPAPDVNTNSMVMGWMFDAYSAAMGEPMPGVVTGKPLALGGSFGREDATARGAFYLLKELKEELGIGKGARVAIQGYGNAGQYIASFLAKDGHKIVAVADSTTTLECAAGLDHEYVTEFKNGGTKLKFLNGSTKPSADGKSIARTSSSTAIVGVDCDVLVPAALEELIHKDNVHEVKAKYIIELANGPVTSAADEVLQEREQIVVPDILANAGGVTVSYYEWVQARQAISWTEEDVFALLQEKMAREGRAVWTLSKQMQIPLRTAANVHAAKRLASGIEAQGTTTFFNARHSTG